MKRNNRKIALIIDNCTAHKFVPLSNVKLIFLPPNATSRLQIMDMGVIHTLKAHYRRLVRRMIAIFEAKKSLDVKDIQFYESIIMLSSAWDQMDGNVIKNCFRKSRYCSETDCEIDLQQTPSEPNSEWGHLVDNINLRLRFDEFIS